MYILSKELKNAPTFRAMVDGVLIKFETENVTQKQLKKMFDDGHPYILKETSKNSNKKSNGKKEINKTES